MKIVERIQKEIQRGPTSHGPMDDAPFPVLSPSEVEKAEAILGLRLPVLMKQLYIEIGNGGFGPGHGLLPLVPSAEIRTECCIVSLYSEFKKSGKWASGVLPFASWGCGIMSCLDVSDKADPPVYRFEPNMPEELTHQSLRGFPYKGAGLVPENTTLEGWLNSWLDGNAEEMFRRANVI